LKKGDRPADIPVASIHDTAGTEIDVDAGNDRRGPAGQSGAGGTCAMPVLRLMLPLRRQMDCGLRLA
jgi:hypothetical protein